MKRIIGMAVDNRCPVPPKCMVKHHGLQIECGSLDIEQVSEYSEGRYAAHGGMATRMVTVFKCGANHRFEVSWTRVEEA